MPLHPETLVEREIGLVGHAVGCSGIDNGFVECEDRVVAIKEMLWYLLDISVESYTEERFFCEDLVYEFFAVHDIRELRLTSDM